MAADKAFEMGERCFFSRSRDGLIRPAGGLDGLMARRTALYICFLGLALSPAGAYSTTILETAAAAAAAGTLQGQQAIQAAKDAKGAAEARQAQIQQAADGGHQDQSQQAQQPAGGGPDQAQPGPSSPAKQAFRGPAGNQGPQGFNDPGAAAGAEPLETEEAEGEIMQASPRVNYKRKISIFYQNDCPPENKTCRRTKVFTNLKSVVYDCDRTHGIFAKASRCETVRHYHIGK